MNKSKKEKKHVSFRFNILFFIVFLLFSTLILKLGVVQIVYGQDYQQEVQRTADVTVNNPAPRGKIYDRNGKVIVDNTPLNAITYTRSQNETPQEMLKAAKKLSTLISIDPNVIAQIPIRDKKDYWILKNPSKAKALVTNKEWSLFKQNKLDDNQIYNLQLKRINPKDLNFSQKDLKILAIYRQINSGYSLTPQIIKNQNVTPQEFAVISENLGKLPGVDTTTDWERKYVYGGTLKTVLGTVSSSEQGLPKDQLDKYLAEGYSRNDRVGTSYLEQEYNDVLEGHKAVIKNVTDSAGNIISTQTVSNGQRGDDLVLTIDMDLQQQTEKIIENVLWKTKQNPASTLTDRAFVVVMNPHTGEILTMAGKQIVNNPQTGKPEMQDFALGNITTSYNVGSAVKGATVLTGYETGAIKPGQVQVDEPLRIQGTPLEKSWKTFGPINDLRALQVSSNVYMWKTVIAMAGGHYVPGAPLDLKLNYGFSTLRNSFAQFGLGVLTGIDLPNEMAGFKGSEISPGKLMYLGIGQYDTYTTMQLAQYVSTIANGGYRVAPHIVKELRDPSSNNNQLGPIIQQIQPKILDKINAKDSWIKRVQEGFRMVAQVGDGTLVQYFGNAPYDPAGKSGTAQAFYDGPLRKQFGVNDPEVMNLSMVAFAPASNPEVAMAVIVPWAYQGATGPAPNEEIGRQVMDAYFNLKKQRQQAKQNLPTSDAAVQNGGSNQQNIPGQ